MGVWEKGSLNGPGEAAGDGFTSEVAVELGGQGRKERAFQAKMQSVFRKLSTIQDVRNFK